MKLIARSLRFAVVAVVVLTHTISNPMAVLAGADPPEPPQPFDRIPTQNSAASKTLPGGGTAIARNILRATWDPDGASHMDGIARTELSSGVNWTFTIEARVFRLSMDGASQGGTTWRTKINVTGGASAEKVKVKVGNPNGHLWRNETDHRVTGNDVFWFPRLINTWDCRPTCH